MREAYHYRDVQVEWVTDDIVQLIVNMDAAGPRIDSVCWTLALAIDEVAAVLDAEDGMTFMAFQQQFNSARKMIAARKLKDRKSP